MCPQCRQPLPAAQNAGDAVFLCSCGAAHTREGGAKTIAYEVAAFGRQPAGQAAYIPFWRVLAYVKVQHREVKGGTLWKLGRLLFGGGPNEGFINVFVPATRLDPDTFKRWATMLTNQPPTIRPANGLGGVPRLPTLVTTAEAAELADFIILSNEAEQPGVLQELSYTFEPREFHLVYLPFTYDGASYQFAL